MSDYKIGDDMSMTALDALTTPVPDPQPEFSEYQLMRQLGDMSMRGYGPPSILWRLPMRTVEEVAQLEQFKSVSPLRIQSRNRFDEPTIYEVLMNWPDTRQDGNHMPSFQGYRKDLEIVFYILETIEEAS